MPAVYMDPYKIYRSARSPLVSTAKVDPQDFTPRISVWRNQGGCASATYSEMTIYSGFRVDGTNPYMSFRWGSIYTTFWGLCNLL